MYASLYKWFIIQIVGTEGSHDAPKNLILSTKFLLRHNPSQSRALWKVRCNQPDVCNFYFYNCSIFLLFSKWTGTPWTPLIYRWERSGFNTIYTRNQVLNAESNLPVVFLMKIFTKRGSYCFPFQEHFYITIIIIIISVTTVLCTCLYGVCDYILLIKLFSSLQTMWILRKETAHKLYPCQKFSTTKTDKIKKIFSTWNCYTAIMLLVTHQYLFL